MTKPTLVFFGTSEFAVQAFETLRGRDVLPVLVVTETDKPKGRGRTVSEPPVKTWAIRNGFQVFQPSAFDQVTSQKLQVANADLFIVAAYGKILPKSVLDLPSKGVLNIHPSLLPKYRGASPIRSAIAADDRETGVSIIKIDEKMDHGPIVAQKPVSFKPWPPDADEAELSLAREGAMIIADILPDWVSGKIQPKQQNDSEATFTKKITKENARISLGGDSYKNWLLFKAYRASPGVFFTKERNGKNMRVRVVNAEFAEGEFRILRVIPENKKEMGYEDFLRGV